MKRVLRDAAFGAAVYWVPDVVLHLIDPDSSKVLLLLTLVVPLIVLAAFSRLGAWGWIQTSSPATPVLMLLGIWALGPPAIAIGMIRGGATFLTDVPAFLAVWAIFPLSTFVMSTYSGSLGGLLLTSAALTVLACVPSARRRLVAFSIPAHP